MMTHAVKWKIKYNNNPSIAAVIYNVEKSFWTLRLKPVFCYYEYTRRIFLLFYRNESNK